MGIDLRMIANLEGKLALCPLDYERTRVRRNKSLIVAIVLGSQ